MSTDAASAPAGAPATDEWTTDEWVDGADWARRVAECAGRLTVALGLGDPPDRVAAEVLRLIGPPADRYATHPQWPSAMSVFGPPVELSLRLDWGRRPALRFVVDVTDHRTGLAGNWDRYLRAARLVTGPTVPDDLLRGLQDLQLTGMPWPVRTPMMHGLGYGPDRSRRATLYFRSWLPDPTIVDHRRAPALRHAAGKIALPVELVGYDLSEAGIDRIKLYCRTGHAAIATALGRETADHPTFGAAVGLLAAFGEAAGLRAESVDDVHMMQLGTGPGHAVEDADGAPTAIPVRTKVFLPAGTWGWTGRSGFGALIGHLLPALGGRLDPLGTLLELVGQHRLRLAPSYVAVSGPADEPSLTFYFSPAPAATGTATGRRRGNPGAAARRSPRSRRAIVDDLVSGGLGHLARAQDHDGTWRDYDVRAGTDVNGGQVTLTGQGTQFVTAYVGSCLIGEPTAEAMLARARRALAGRDPAGGLGWGWNDATPPDPESTALAIRVLATAPATLVSATATDRERSTAVGLEPLAMITGLRPVDADPQTAAVAVLALLDLLSALPTARPVRDMAQRALPTGTALLGGPTPGRWSTDLVAAASTAELVGRGQGGAALRRWTTAALSAPVPADPFALGHWLRGWHLIGGSPSCTAVRRAVVALRAARTDEGGWHGGPHRRLPYAMEGPLPSEGRTSGAYAVDRRGLVTTASVVRGLCALRRVMPDDRSSR